MFFPQLIGYICPIYLFIVLPVDIDTSKIQFSIVLPLCLLLMPVLFDFGLTTEAYSAFPASTGSFCTGTNMILSLKNIWNRRRNKDMKSGMMVINVNSGGYGVKRHFQQYFSYFVEVWQFTKDNTIDHGVLWHRYSVAINQVIIMTIKRSKWWLQLNH